MNAINKRFILSVLFFISLCYVNAQTAAVDTAYLRVVNQRADKIVATLGVTKEKEATKVRDIISKQYQDLNRIHEKRDAELKKAKEENSSAEDIKKIQSETESALAKLHQSYLSQLSKHLKEEQIEKVKDGMTYNVVPITYKGYQEMIPTLTEDQKKQIKLYLVEAREHAMDAGTSDEKHKWFGKYKGRINNYLSAAGYNLKKEGEEWERRKKEASMKGK